LKKKETHIVFVLQRLHPGGSERQVSYLARYLKSQKDLNVTVLYFGAHETTAASWFEPYGVKLMSFGFNEKLIIGSAGNLTALLRKLKLLFKMILFLRKLQPTILVPFTYEPNVLMARYWKLTGANACIWNQRDVGLYFEETGAELRALKNCSAWVANSPASAAFLNKYAVKQIHIIHNAVELKKNHHPAKNDKLRVVMIGNLHVNKDHLTLLKAWKKVMTHYTDREAELLFAGGNGNAKETILEFINNNQLNTSVVLAGTVSNISELLSSCDIGVLSSKAEGLPNAVLEYMAASLPVIATDIEGNRYALGNEYRFLTPVEDADRMAEQLLELMQDLPLRTQTGTANRQRIIHEFSVEKMGNSYHQLLQQFFQAN
jgi:glycosyltransferase involved in cell wall biosynthesis